MAYVEGFFPANTFAGLFGFVCIGLRTAMFAKKNFCCDNFTINRLVVAFGQGTVCLLAVHPYRGILGEATTGFGVEIEGHASKFLEFTSLVRIPGNYRDVPRESVLPGQVNDIKVFPVIGQADENPVEVVEFGV